jgi:hypothetical protein
MIHLRVKRAKRGLLKRNQWTASIVAANTLQLVVDSIQGGQYTSED